MNKDEMIEEMATHMVDYCDRFQMCPYDADSNVTCDICKARSLYNANCRIIADDEMVVKKRQYEQLKKYNRDRKRLRLKWQIAEQEKRQILQVLKDNIVNRIGTKYAVIDLTDIAQRANKLGIELEDKDNDDK